ncbi:hypothetical protein KKI24_26610 [bacterium]|nr:hypothetical protein [bacterium]
MFAKKSVKHRDLILKMAMKEIEKMLRELEKEGKDLSLMKLRKFQKTHHIDCICAKCKKAEQKKNPRLRGLREYGFKVYVSENDLEEIDHSNSFFSD